MYEILSNCGNMFLISVLGYLVVLLAMSIDLVSGIRKAKVRGEFTNSTALSRSVTKFITYEGGMMIGTGVDLLIHLGKFWELLSLDVMLGVPVVTLLIGIFICGVEYLSIREKADAKTKKDMKQAAVIAGKIASTMLNKEELAEAITQALINAGSNKN